MKTNILKMIEQAEVEWKTLDTLVNVITAPTKVKKEKYKDQGLIPIIDQGEKFIAGYLDDDLSTVPSGEYIIFGDHSEHIKYVDFAFIQGADGLKILKPKEDYTKYLFYAFQNFYVKEKNYKRHWSSAKETLIPIPPLELQKEIVKRLDILTELEATLEATLEAELILRKKQYRYYRDFLLSESELAKVGFEWKSLGEVAEVYSGGTPSKTKDEYWLNGNIPWLKSEVCKDCIVNEATHFITELGLKNSSARYFRKGTVLMAMVGATIFKVGFLNFRATTNQNIVGIQANREVLLDKYVYYWLMNSYEKFISKLSGYNMINLSQIKGFKIPIPPLDTQAQIVNILDKFDRLTSSITEGLPKEIELRRKQYEYYRELLLNFPKV